MDGQRHAPAALPPGKWPVPIIQEAGWVPGPVWTVAQNLASTGIQSPDRPVRSESLYRLSYPCPQLSLHNYKIGDPVLLENGRVFHVIKPRRKSSCENLLNFRNISEHRKDYPLTTACHESLNIQFLRSGSKAVCPMSQICGT